VSKPPAPIATAGEAVADPPIIRMSGVTRRFNGLTAVNDLSLGVRRGAILGLIGPSGSGKTTAIRMLTGTLEPSAGEIRVLGEDPADFTRRTREQIAYMPQLFSLYRDLTARENVGFVAALYGVGWFGRRRRIRRALEVVDLWDARNRRAGALSGGMQRRLELACALVHEPSVLFVDEPTSGIDPMLRIAIWDELREMRDAGRTLLVTTQQVSEAEYCDEVALIADGELVALDTPEALRRSVFGGAVLEIDTERAVDPEILAGVADVLSVRQPAARQLIVVVADAGAATPQLADAFRAGGVEVARMREHQPSFDEVFSSLVERHREERRGSGGAPPSAEEVERAA
jgi:ABC-2 type transport system ATP-binding protein